MSYCNECRNNAECDSGCWKGAALILAERWENVHTDESYGASGKNLGTLARAFLKMRAEKVPSERGHIDLSSYVNAAHISGADSPHVVVQKLQLAINAAPQSTGCTIAAGKSDSSAESVKAETRGTADLPAGAVSPDKQHPLSVENLLAQVEKALRKNPLIAMFLDQGFWHAHHVDIVIRHDGQDRRYEADWIVDLWYIVRRRGLSVTDAVVAAQEAQAGEGVSGGQADSR